MNQENALSSPLFVGSGLLALLLYFGWSPDPAMKEESQANKSPVEFNTIYPSVSGTLSLAGSMWDDPFKDIQNEKLKSITEPTHAIQDLIENKLTKNQKLMMLVIPVQEGDRPVDIENRRRRRHAVELALANQGYQAPFWDRMTYRS
ncbi:hypothetical protein [Allorhodopirellula solitaria]|uniref:Uncharacterized protein n=1 Tax=Allorhodopirellula solitaria TaxID=2527987 RepID=A0A5C5XSW4_9BACT|nr:hypothetical protein [Allorhodopirellula solitaria]TWT65095.1 hypothetical protein CA85_34410 [Allorhodopirellula solitaria]